MRHAVGNGGVGGGKAGGMCASAINLPAASTMETPQLRPKLTTMTAKPANNTLPSPTRNHEDDDNEHQVKFVFGLAVLVSIDQEMGHSCNHTLFACGNEHSDSPPNLKFRLGGPQTTFRDLLALGLRIN